LRVLLVEDEALVRMLGVDVLEEAGYEVVEAGNADEALRILEAQSGVKALFTDVDMPGSMDGLALAHTVHARWPQVKVLVVSGKVRPAPDELPPGGVFMGKPYEPASLVRQLRELLVG
jgi:two-component system, response regulator PdtaR